LEEKYFKSILEVFEKKIKIKNIGKHGFFTFLK